MTHYAYREGQTFELEADYVVVGTGAGGATAAVSLARGGADVLMVEAGAWRDPEDYPTSVYGTLRDLMDDWGTLLAKGRAFWPIVQARTVGGTTVINSAIVVRTPGDVFRLWEREHGLPEAELSERVWAYQDEVENELSVEAVPEPARGRSNDLALEASTALGIEGHVMHRSVKGCLGKGQCLQGCRAGKKQSTNVTYVPETLKLGGKLVTCAPVEQVAFEGNRAVGVRGHFVHPNTKKKGANFFIRAKKAVLMAASCTHGPTILLKSGVRHKALGHGFRAHPGTGVFGHYDDPVDMNVGATQGWASLEYRDDPGLKLETLSLPLELVASRLSGGGSELMHRLADYRHLCMWVAAIRAESVGQVKVGFGGKPAVHYTLNTNDMKRLRFGLHKVAKLHIAAGARHVIPGIHGMPYKLMPNEVDKLLEASLDPRHYIAISSHLFGGSVMGADKERAVCDARGRVYGYDGLVIADASQIPTTLGVNPQHTIMALARLRAHQLLEA